MNNANIWLLRASPGDATNRTCCRRTATDHDFTGRCSRFNLLRPAGFDSWRCHFRSRKAVITTGELGILCTNFSWYFLESHSSSEVKMFPNAPMVCVMLIYEQFKAKKKRDSLAFLLYDMLQRFKLITFEFQMASTRYHSKHPSR